MKSFCFLIPSHFAFPTSEHGRIPFLDYRLGDCFICHLPIMRPFAERNVTLNFVILICLLNRFDRRRTSSTPKVFNIANNHTFFWVLLLLVVLVSSFTCLLFVFDCCRKKWHRIVGDLVVNSLDALRLKRAREKVRFLC